MLSAHIEVKRHLTERAEDGNVLAKLKVCKAYDCELDIAGILMQADHMLVELFDGSFTKTDERDDKMAQILEALDIRGLRRHPFGCAWCWQRGACSRACP